MIQTMNQPVPLVRATRYESATGTNMPRIKQMLCTQDVSDLIQVHDQPNALFIQFNVPIIAIVAPITMISQKENLLSENPLDDDL